MSFHDVIQSAHDFALATGTAAATLVGLLFVGLSLHLHVVVNRDDVRALARVTFTSFAVVLVTSLFILIPEDGADLSIELIIGGAIGLVVSAQTLTGVLTPSQRMLNARAVLFRFFRSVVGFAGLILAGALFGAGTLRGALPALYSSVILLLTVSLRSTWDALVTVGAATLRERTDRP